jgi:cell division septation protein DedD
MKRKALALTLIMALLFSAAAGTLGIGNVGSADSVVDDWPMFHYDAAHSGSPDNIAPAAHDLLWSFNTITSADPPPAIISSSPAVVGGVVYIGADDGVAFALNATTGEKIWNYTTIYQVQATPAIAGGVVYVGSNDGNLYALDASTGAKIWNYSSEYIRSSAAVARGVIYFGTGYGNIYAIGTPQPSSSPTPPPSSSPFPSPILPPAPSPSPSPAEGQPSSPTPTPTATPDDQSTQKPTSTPDQQTPVPSSTILIVASVATLTFVGSGFLVYFKKRKHNEITGKTN